MNNSAKNAPMLRVPSTAERKNAESTLTERADGSFGYREVAVVTYVSDYGGIRIFVRVHLTEVNGQPVVDREILEVTGCP